MRCLLIILLIIAALVESGCDAYQPPVPEPPDEPAIAAVLRAYTDRQRLLLTRVLPVDENQLTLAEEDFVQEAEVRVGGVLFQVVPVDSIDRRAVGPFDTYNYYTDSLDVQTGRTYRLMIRHDGQTIRGQVVVPDTFRGDAEGLRIFWRPSEGAARYHIEITRAPPDSVQPTFIWQREYLTTDTSVTVIPDEDFEPGRHWVVIQALDENLAAFQAGSTTRAGLEEAYGVFGAVTTIEGYVQLRHTPEAEASISPLRPHPPR